MGSPLETAEGFLVMLFLAVVANTLAIVRSGLDLVKLVAQIFRLE